MNCFSIKPLLYLIVAFVAQAADAATPTAEQTRFFEESVRPLLAARCYSCHGEEKQRGELRVDSLGGLLAGGESGPAIEPGDPDASLLVEAIRFESYEMPPSGQMPDEEIAVLTRWIKLGAQWPGDDGSVRPDRHTGPRITDEDRAWWSFQPIADPEPPQVANDNWCQNDLDRFILRKLASEGLTTADQADRRTLIRRVYFDLIGVPPEPHEVDEFLTDSSDDAYARMVDRLLDDSRYGERWARHWLDLVRYAESDGFRADGFRPLAYRYRDYVIRAFNQDKPYDQFVLEQLAGDEVAPHDLDAQAATAYLRHWIYEYNQRDVRTQWDNILVDITNVTGDVFLGLGMGCARCHDHKFDPILQDDYFSLKAFFTPLLPRDDVPYATGEQLAEYQRQQAEWEAKTGDIRRQMLELEQPLIDRAKQRAVEKFPRDIRPMILKDPEDREPLEHQLACLSERQSQAEVANLDFAKQLKGESLEKWQTLKAELDKFDSLKPKPLPAGFTVTDVGSVAPPTTIPSDRSGREIQPAFLTVLDLPPCEITPPESRISTGRRTALARWLGSPENPLASRVIVNRIWQQHFGVGLVATASDFGHLGELPTHPELLDWLATRFMENGWRFKVLHRLILNSATYQQSSLRPAPQIALEKDPGNRWLWRMPVRRLDAEQIRDAVLAVSGELSPTAGGPSVDPSQTRRSIYCRVLRNKRDPLLDAFDAADGFSSTDSRNVTTTPTQSLMMINGPWPLKRARAFASRLRKTNPANDAELVEQAYRLAYSRSPDSLEREMAIGFLRSQAEQLQAERSASVKQEPTVHKMPVLDSQAAQVDDNRPEDRLVLPENESLPSGDFTIEAVIMLRSLYPDATVRTIAAHWDNNNSHPGWALGVTSTKSAYQPRNLILQMVGDPAKGGAGYEVIASNLRPELNKPYYVAASIKIADPSPAGITFYLKDLSKPDAPLQKAQVAHKVTEHYRSPGSLVLGGREDGARHCWDGLLDDVRLTAAALPEPELLIHNDSADQRTVGFWRFEAEKGFYQDVSPSQNTLFAATGELLDAKSAALVDFCHVLLNSNEFIYVD